MDNYNPPQTAPIQEEFPSGPEITEAEDPTVEEENALRNAQQEAAEAAEEMEEAEEEEDDDENWWLGRGSNSVTNNWVLMRKRSSCQLWT